MNYTKNIFNILIILFLIITIFQELDAQEISPQIAEKAAIAWFKNSIASDIQNLQKVAYDKDIIEIKDNLNIETLAYVIELEPKGFIIISPNININPIIGYSATSKFDPTPSNQNILLHLIKLDLSNRLKALRDGYISEHVKNKAQSDWNGLLNGFTESFWDVEVGPLLSTAWDQGEVNEENVFNIYTPNNWVCGCVATAAAQILKYYNWPLRGSGTHSYVEDDAGILSANFGTMTYAWSDMLDNYSNSATLAQREAVGLLTYHVGIAANMNYEEYGSSASSCDAANAFNNYFRTTGEYVNSENDDFYNRLYSNIISEKPVLLSIADSTDDESGHAIVADGVSHNTGDTKYYHLNFGWSGNGDGWYNLETEYIADSHIYNVVNSAVMDIVPNPMFYDPGDSVTTGNYTVSWDVSAKLNADYFELEEGIQATSLSTLFDGAESGTVNWAIDGNWESTTTQHLSDDKSFRGYLAPGTLNKTHKITLNKSFYISESTSITYYWMTNYFECEGVDYAEAYFQVSTDGVWWTTLKTHTQENELVWNSENNINLYDYIGEMIFIRFAIEYKGGTYYDGSEYNDVGFFVDDLSVNNGHEVTWSTLDSNVLGNSLSITGKSYGTYYYKVRAYRDSTWWGWSNTDYITVEKSTNIDDVDEIIPKEFIIYQNYPNPFNPETTMKYQVSKLSDVSIKIYDIIGQEVKTLVNKKQFQGIYYIKWDGTNNFGVKVSSGIYIYRMETNSSFVKARKMVYLK